MKLTKAIELNKDVVISLRQGKRPDHADAVALGNEALKHYLDSSAYAIGCLLPGQTEETEEYANGR